MIIIDANTGHKLVKGKAFTNVNGTFVILETEDNGRGKARVLSKRLEHNPDGLTCDYDPPLGTTQWVPLVVRYTHPAFFLRRVGFYPS